MKLFTALLLLFVLVSPVLAQAPAAVPPVASVPAVDSPQIIPLDKDVETSIQLAALELENADLKVQMLTTQRDALRAKLEQLAKDIARPGYVIRKGQDGKWEFAKQTPVPKDK